MEARIKNKDVCRTLTQQKTEVAHLWTEKTKQIYFGSNFYTSEWGISFADLFVKKKPCLKLVFGLDTCSILCIRWAFRCFLFIYVFIYFGYLLQESAAGQKSSAYTKHQQSFYLFLYFYFNISPWRSCRSPHVRSAALVILQNRLQQFIKVHESVNPWIGNNIWTKKHLTFSFP